MITISLRSYSSHIKSLLHFNYPYYAETGDGLADDTGLFTWTRSGSAKLAGSEIPADVIISGTPKFGYRCLHTESNSDFITGTSSASLSLSSIECSMWIRLTATGTGNIMQLKSGSTVILTLSVNASNQLIASSSSLGVNLTSSETLSLNTWAYLRLQVSASNANISLNNSAGASQSLSASSLPGFNTITLGGLHGEIDEFTLRDTFTSALPAEPAKAVCNANALGGFGDGRLGNVTLTAACIMNSTACISASRGDNSSGYYYTNQGAGKFGIFTAGDEVMLLNPKTGAYAFRTITSYGGGRIKFNSALPSELTEEYTQIIQIPNFNTLTINSGVTITPKKWDNMTGGIIAFRVKGNCTINGSLITSGYGRPRTDMLQITHSKLIDQFITNTGGGIFIACGGTFTAGSSARLGASWSGAGKGGSGSVGSSSGNGGAGYGGGGAGDDDSSSSGGKGGVGGGGGGANGSSGHNYQAGDAGTDNSTGGFGITDGTKCSGGTQGDNSSAGYITGAVSGGGGAGGCSGTTGGVYGSSGANIILITKTLKADSAAISTGGQGGQYSGKAGSHTASGGGGTGFCYIACERTA